MNYKIYITTIISIILLFFIPKSFVLSIIPIITTIIFALAVRRYLYSGLSRRTLYIKYLIPNIINVIVITSTVGILIATGEENFYKLPYSNTNLIKAIIFTALYLSAQVGTCSIFFYSTWDAPFSISRAIVWMICYIFCCGICYGIEEYVFSMNFHLILIAISAIVFNFLFYKWFKNVTM